MLYYRRETNTGEQDKTSKLKEKRPREDTRNKYRYRDSHIRTLGNPTKILNWRGVSGVMVHTFHPSTGRQRKSDLCEFEANLVYKS